MDERYTDEQPDSTPLPKEDIGADETAPAPVPADQQDDPPEPPARRTVLGMSPNTVRFGILGLGIGYVLYGLYGLLASRGILPDVQFSAYIPAVICIGLFGWLGNRYDKAHPEEPLPPVPDDAEEAEE